MKDNQLLTRCRINTNYGTDTFVGIKATKEGLVVSFPLGFDCSISEESKTRTDILCLLAALSRFGSSKESDGAKQNVEKLFDFPIQSYQYIILDFLKNGYYRECETIFAQAPTGKINWKKTIQRTKPLYTEYGAVYMDFIVRKAKINENAILTRIHEWCVYESFLKLGWLYTELLPAKPTIKFNKKMFLSVLNQELTVTFNDTKKRLLNAMKNIVESLSEQSIFDGNFVYGTNKFEYIWESAVDYVFGENNKEDYFPKTQWVMKNTLIPIETPSVLYPDTIMLLDDKVYILDAKYYKFGATRNPYDLPKTTSIQKQITYGEYLSNPKATVFKKKNFPFSEIYNAFIMPYRSNTEDKYEFVGFARADWKDDTFSYEKVLGVLVDTKHLLNITTKKKRTEILKLSALIENTIEELNYNLLCGEYD